MSERNTLIDINYYMGIEKDKFILTGDQVDLRCSDISRSIFSRSIYETVIDGTVYQIKENKNYFIFNNGGSLLVELVFGSFWRDLFRQPKWFILEGNEDLKITPRRGSYWTIDRRDSCIGVFKLGAYHDPSRNIKAGIMSIRTDDLNQNRKEIFALTIVLLIYTYIVQMPTDYPDATPYSWLGYKKVDRQSLEDFEIE